MIRDDGDLVADQIDGGVPWQEAAADAAFDPAFAAELSDAITKAPAAHTVHLALTPVNLDRDGLALRRGAATAEPLVAPRDTVALDDSLVIRGYLACCARLIQQFHLAYFACAIEANTVARKAPSKWLAFLILAESTRTTLKRNHPTLAVFATITGIAALAPGKPFAVTETGWPAETVTVPFPLDIPGSPALRRRTNAPLFRQWRDHGLYAGDGRPRPALNAWREWLARLLDGAMER